MLSLKKKKEKFIVTEAKIVVTRAWEWGGGSKTFFFFNWKEKKLELWLSVVVGGVMEITI